MKHSTHELQDTRRERRYMAGLDGLRAIAVFAVIAYHLQLGWAPGGLLGVGVFFVLSGYLITDILAEQWRQTRRLDLKDFWLRRVRRLLPAMIVMIAGVMAWVALFRPAQLPNLQEDAMASVLYVMNWWFVYHQVSYFESFGPPSPLGHLWSLAVEEQFYLLWPLLLAIGLRFIPQRGKLILVTVAGIAASALAMAWLYEPGTDPSRVYYGTDTRAFSLLIGAVLAMVWPSRRLSSRVSPASRVTLDLSGITALLIVFLLIWRTNEYDAFLYQGGMVVLSVAAAIAVAVLAHPASLLAKLLGCKPLKWLGLRSYGIYLWHYPVIILTSPAVQTGGIDVPRAIMQVAATIGLAALSWRFVEEPIRQGAMRKLWTRILTGQHRRAFRPGKLWITSAIAFSALMLLGGGTGGWFPRTDANVVSVAGVIPPSSSIIPESTPSPTPIPTPVPTPVHQISTATPTPPVVDKPIQPKPTDPIHPHAPASGKGITVIGDSVILDAEPYLEKLLPGVHVEGKVGRQMSHAADIIKQLESEGKLGNRVLIELGTNGSFSKKQLDALLLSLKGKQQVILVNTRVPRPWEDEVNTTLAAAAEKCTNVTLVDWYTASKDKNSLFYEDGVHLNAEGAEYYATVLANAIEPAAGTSHS